MNHLNEEEMVLKHYNELEDAVLQSHLAECAQCQAEAQRLSAALAQVPQMKVPALSDDYEAQVWAKLRSRLPEKRQSWLGEMLRPRQWAVAGAMAILLVAAFVGGRIWEHKHKGPIAGPDLATVSNAAGRDRVVSVSLDRHFERTQILLVEVLAAQPNDKADFAATEEQARDLLDSNRLYRSSSAPTAKDPAVQKTLDDLERVLVEIANSPQNASQEDIDRLQKNIESQGLLFKVRVIGSKLREQNKLVSNKSNGSKT